MKISLLYLFSYRLLACGYLITACNGHNFLSSDLDRHIRCHQMQFGCQSLNCHEDQSS